MKTTTLASLFIAFCFQAQSQSADNEMHFESFADPLFVELTNAGLPPRLAEMEVTRLIGSLKKCWASEYNQVDSDEQEIESFQLGGETVVSYKSPCLSAFLLAVDQITPGRRSGN